jgi:hypothetical protein
MANQEIVVVFDFLTKRWDLIFYKRRLFVEGRTYLDITSDHGACNDDFKVFWLESEDHMPYLLKMRELCCGVTLKNLEQRTGGSDSHVSAWLDDREHIPDNPSGYLRLYQHISSSRTRLTAADLYEYLSEKVRKFGPLSLEC